MLGSRRTRTANSEFRPNEFLVADQYLSKNEYTVEKYNCRMWYIRASCCSSDDSSDPW